MIASCTKPIIQNEREEQSLGKPGKKEGIREGEWVRYYRGTSGDRGGL